MSLDKEKFVKALSSNKILLNKLTTDPKLVLAEFGLKISDNLANTIKEQATMLIKQGTSPVVIAGEVFETLWNGKDKPWQI